MANHMNTETHYFGRHSSVPAHPPTDRRIVYTAEQLPATMRAIAAVAEMNARLAAKDAAAEDLAAIAEMEARLAPKDAAAEDLAAIAEMEARLAAEYAELAEMEARHAAENAVMRPVPSAPPAHLIREIRVARFAKPPQHKAVHLLRYETSELAIDLGHAEARCACLRFQKRNLERSNPDDVDRLAELDREIAAAQYVTVRLSEQLETARHA